VFPAVAFTMNGTCAAINYDPLRLIAWFFVQKPKIPNQGDTTYVKEIV
jgi:hypothetical protein